MVIAIFAIYSSRFWFSSFPSITSFIYRWCVNKCVFRYIFCTNITCAEVTYLWWIKSIEFCYSWAICIYNFRNTFHVVVVRSTLKFDKFLTNNTLTKDTRCQLSRICCRSYRFVTRDCTVAWSCELLPCKTCLRVACKIYFISSWSVNLTFCILATIN